jgi:polysaccharide biosynthesis transport protein
MNTDIFELRSLLTPLRRYYLLLVVGVIVGGVLGYLGSINPPVYLATTKVLVQGQSGGAPTFNDVNSGRELATTYQQLVTVRSILVDVSEALDGRLSPEGLASKISVSTALNVLEISALDESPFDAAIIANATANEFVDSVLRRQIVRLAQFQAALAAGGIPYSEGIIAAQANVSSAFSIVEEAVPPTSPSGPSDILVIAIAALSGLAVAVAAAVALQQMDRSIKTVEQLLEVSDAPLLGTVPISPQALTSAERLAERSQVFDFLHLGISFSSVDSESDLRLVVTSAEPHEGKTTISSGLAIAMAKSGTPTLLIDGDLRRPSVHKIFGSAHSPGLSTVVMGELSIDEAIRPTEIPLLSVLSAGPMPPDVNAFIKSHRFHDVVERIKSKNVAIIVDSPPSLAVSDSVLWAELMGSLLLIVSRKTSQSAVAAVTQRFSTFGVVPVGQVFNKVEAQDKTYYHYGYGYGQEGADSSGSTWTKKVGLGWLSRLLRRGRDVRLD